LDTKEKYIRNTRKGYRGEGWRRSVGPIMRVMKKCYEESRRRGISYKLQKEGRLNGLVTSCVGSDGKMMKTT
jgi:hypothetical protein